MTREYIECIERSGNTLKCSYKSVIPWLKYTGSTEKIGNDQMARLIVPLDNAKAQVRGLFPNELRINDQGY